MLTQVWDNRDGLLCNFLYQFDSNNIWMECPLLDKEAKCTFTTNRALFLSDGLDKAGSNFFRYEAIRFPQIGMFLFLHKEYMKLQKGSLRNKMYQNPL